MRALAVCAVVAATSGCDVLLLSGTLKDLYIALARVAKLDVTSPEQQMVFAKISNGYFFSFEVGTLSAPLNHWIGLSPEGWIDHATVCQPLDLNPCSPGNMRNT